MQANGLHAPAVLPQGKNAGTNWIGGFVDSAASQDVFVDNKCPSIGIRTSFRPSPWRRRNTAYELCSHPPPHYKVHKNAKYSAQTLNTNFIRVSVARTELQML